MNGRALALAFGAVLMSVALAGSIQQGGPGGGGRGGRQGGGMGQGGMQRGMRGGPQPLAMIAARPDVARDIALTDQQGEAIRTLLESLRPARGQQGQQNQRPDRDTMQAQRQAQMAAADKQLATILSTAQYARVEEISIQLRGLSAALDPKVQVKLDLTSDQKEALARLARPPQGPRGGGQGGPPPDDGQGGPPPPPPGEGGEGQGGPPPDGGQGGPPPEGGRQGGPGGRGMRPGGGDPRLNAEIDKILTDSQKAKLTALGGKKFVADPPRERGPGGPGGPGGPPPGGGPALDLMAAVLGER